MHLYRCAGSRARANSLSRCSGLAGGGVGRDCQHVQGFFSFSFFYLPCVTGTRAGMWDSKCIRGIFLFLFVYSLLHSFFIFVYLFFVCGLLAGVLDETAAMFFFYFSIFFYSFCFV